MLRLARDQGDILLQGSCFGSKASLVRAHPTLYTYAPYSQQDECTKLSQKRPGRLFEVSMNLWVDHHPDSWYTCVCFGQFGDPPTVAHAKVILFQLKSLGNISSGPIWLPPRITSPCWVTHKILGSYMIKYTDQRRWTTDINISYTPAHSTTPLQEIVQA